MSGHVTEPFNEQAKEQKQPKRSGLYQSFESASDSNTTPSQPQNDPPRVTRVGTILNHTFSEHPKAGIGQDSDGHRALNAGRLIDELNIMFGADNQEIQTSNSPASRHVHLIHVLPGEKTKDIEESDDVVLSFQPLKANDLHNPDTATGLFIRNHVLSTPPNFYTPYYDWAEISETIHELQSEQSDPSQFPSYEDIYQKHTERYLEGNALEEIGDKVFHANPVTINGETFFVPDPRDYPQANIKHHEKLSIEIPPDVTFEIDAKKKNRGYLITFKKDGEIVGGIDINAQDLNQDNITITTVPYGDYNMLERGTADLLNAEAAMINKISDAINYEHTNALPDNLTREEYTNAQNAILEDAAHQYMSGMRTVYTKYTAMLLENARDTGQPQPEINRLERILEIMEDDNVSLKEIDENLAPFIQEIQNENAQRFQNFRQSGNTPRP